MNYRFFILLFCFAALSCKKEPALVFSLETFSQKDLELCKNEPCSKIDISYPKANGVEIIAKNINTEIESLLVGSLFLGDEEGTSTASISEAAAEFIMAYRDHQADTPTDIDMGGYEAQIDMHVIRQTEDFISIEWDSYFFTGGAHGNTYTTYLNFDTQTGEQIDIESLINNFDSFENFVEEAFRKEHKISKDVSINDTGFWFDNDTFYVSNNVGFTNEKIIIVYNTYEIAPYSTGAITLEIPLEEIEPFLNDSVL